MKICFFIEALREQGNKFVKEMYGDELASLRHRAQSLLRQKRTPLGNTEWNTEWETRLRDLLRTTKNAGPKFLCFADVARSGPAANLYVFYSQLSADAAHPTTHALSRHLTWINSNGEPMFGIDVQPVPSENQLADTLDLACTAALGVLLNVTAIFGQTVANFELTQALSQHKALQRLKPAEEEG